jgi:protein-tyrosine phosphatase
MGFFSGLFTKKEYPEFDFKLFGVDMHSHLIPGIDDGAATIENSIEMLRAFKELGYSKIITTPHIKTGSFENTSDIILNGAKEVKKAIQVHNLDIEFEAAAEYYFDYSFLEKIEANDILSFSNRHVLVEYSFHQRPMGYKEMIFALQLKKYIPIIAHYERYPYYHGGFANAEKLRDRGAKIQVNLLSLFGHYGPQIQKQAELLIKNKQVDLVGTDCHRLEHLQLLKANAKNPLLHSLKDLNLLNSQF